MTYMKKKTVNITQEKIPLFFLVILHFEYVILLFRELFTALFQHIITWPKLPTPTLAKITDFIKIQISIIHCKLIFLPC